MPRANRRPASADFPGAFAVCLRDCLAASRLAPRARGVRAYGHASGARAGLGHACGFSLVELAVVLFVVSLLLGGLMLPLSAQREQQQRAAVARQLNEAREALLGFAAITGRVPCPAPMPGAVEAISGNHCAAVAGYMPGPTLGLLPTDPWGRSLRMATASSYVNVMNGATVADAATTPGGLMAIYPDMHRGDVRACASSPASYYVHTGGDCPAGSPPIAEAIGAVIWSDGPDPTTNADDVVVWPAVPHLAMMMIKAGR